jgi:L-ascorbate metabolism protein UlaG (beta-lactamase superfamily)
MLDAFTWFVQSAFRWRNGDQVVYVDPWHAEGPPADLVFVTHAHFDHFRPDEIAALRRPDTVVVAPRDIAAQLDGPVRAVVPGDAFEIDGLRVEVVPAYNVHPERLDMHPKEAGWVGYVFEAGDFRWYHAGDTDRLPELDAVRADAAFVPIAGTYTMDVEEAADLVRAIAPEVAIPMHFGFVVGQPSDADRFRDAAAPVRVEVLEPSLPFGDLSHEEEWEG